MLSDITSDEGEVNMEENTCELTVHFTILMRDGETEEEARERLISAALDPVITLADHEIDWVVI